MGGCCSVSLSCDQVLNQFCQWLCVKESYVHNIEKNLTTLETTMEELKAKRNDLSRRVEREENRGLRRLDQIQVWLSRVETIESQVNDSLNVRTEELQRLCLYGFCSKNLKLSYHYGKHIFTMLVEVENLISNGVFEVVTEQAQASGVVERPIEPKIVGQKLLLETAWNHFIENGVGLLGLQGMGGVGKTTLLKQINNRIKENVFDVVIWVVVSKDLQIQNIQEEVAKKLGITGEEWSHKDKDQKACVIHNVLRKKKFVLLLDDIWAKVDLTEIGVPFPNRENGSKVVFTTRSQEVCRRMRVDVEMEVQCLSADDALDLFQKTVGEITLGSHPDIPKLANVVAKKCRGLPLALNVIGETMSCKQTIQEWHQNKGYEIIGNLVRSSLLMEEDKIKVYMHDVVREMALWIASDFGKQKDNFIVHAGTGLYEMPKVKNWNIVKRVSLMDNEIYHISGSVECLQLTTLFLQRNKIKFGNISGEFFKSMPRLVVLDLSYNIALSELPKGISELVSLKYFNLSGTAIQCLSIELQKLKNLILLNLENTSQLTSIIGISALWNLKVLRLYDSGVVYNAKTKEELKVLEHLKILTISINSDSSLDEFLSSHNLRCCTQVLKIRGCRLESSDIWRLASMEKLREVKLWSGAIFDIKMDTASITRELVYPLHNSKNALFLSLSKIDLSFCRCPKDLTWLMLAPNLTWLKVDDGHQVKNILNKEKACEGEVSEIVPFQKLEFLGLLNLTELKNIYWRTLPFPCLKVLWVINCPKLRKLPLNSESGEKGLIIDSPFKKWIEGVEWEDEATKARFLPSLNEC